MEAITASTSTWRPRTSPSRLGTTRFQSWAPKSGSGRFRRRLLLDVHHGREATRRKNRNGLAEPHFAAAPLASARNRDQGPDFEPPLTGVVQSLLVGIGRKRRAVVPRPPPQEFAVPLNIDLARIGACRPVRDAARSYERDAFGNGLARRTNGAPEFIGAGRRRQRRCRRAVLRRE